MTEARVLLLHYVEFGLGPRRAMLVRQLPRNMIEVRAYYPDNPELQSYLDRLEEELIRLFGNRSWENTRRKLTAAIKARGEGGFYPSGNPKQDAKTLRKWVS